MLTSVFVSGPDAAPISSAEPGWRHPILVIGGTGHVGAALCNFLLDRGHPVTAASRTDSPVFESSAIGRTRLDVTEPTDTVPLPPLATAVICPWVDNSSGAEPYWIGHLLERLAGAGTTSVVYFSTMWVYGTPADGLLTESTPTAPTNPYSVAHLHNESVLTDSAQDLGFDVSILRMANLVGPDPFYRYRSKVSFVHELVEMAVRDKVIVLRSPPSTPRNLLTRTLLHHNLAAVLDRNVVERRVDILNLGGGSTTTMVELARKVAAMTERYDGAPVRVEHPGEPASQPTFHLDTTKIRSVAGSGTDDLTAELELVLKDIIQNRIPASGTGEQ